MKQRKLGALLVLSAALLISSAFTRDSFAQVSMPRINFQQTTLPNGLRVLSAVDHSSPTVAIQVWYHVGSKDDPSGRSGFAHLFEHIMFKATKNMKSEMMDRLTEDDWRRAGTHSESGAYSVHMWLDIYAAHCHDHAEQIRRAVDEAEQVSGAS